MTHSKKADSFTEEDSLVVDKMSIKDPAFVHVLKRGISDTVMFTIQDKCNNFVGRKKVDVQYAKLIKERELVFRQLFAKNGTLSRVQIRPEEESIPYNGFSYFKISYQGDIPKSLRKAYDEMHELNNENPRKHHLREKDLIRDKTLSTIGRPPDKRAE